MIEHLIQSLIGSGPVVAYMASQHIPNTTFQCSLFKCDLYDMLWEHSVPAPMMPEFLSAKDYKIFLSNGHKTLKYMCQAIGTHHEYLRLDLKTGVLEPQLRQDQRQVFIFGSAECRFMNPFDGRTMLRKTMIDRSTSGMSLALHQSSLLFKPGRCLKDMECYQDGKLLDKKSGSIVYTGALYTLHDGLNIQAGVRFDA